jgi:hypothetical protein
MVVSSDGMVSSAAGVTAVWSVSSVIIALVRLGCADRDAVGLKPSKDRTANVLSWPLELCGCGSIDSARQLSRAEHREARIVFGSHGHNQ